MNGDDGEEVTLRSERFVLGQRLGSGAFGAVYEAQDKERQETVALKILINRKGSDLYLFKREFRSLADIRHPNLINLYELLSDGTNWFFTMELIEGIDLHRYLLGGTGLSSWTVKSSAASLSQSQRTLDQTPTASIQGGLEEETVAFPSSEDTTPAADDALTIVPPLTGEEVKLNEARLRRSLVQLAEGLNALHEAGKLHRDIKPSNVLVEPDGRLVLLDFGVSSDLKLRSKLGRAPGLMGTPRYMAPEIVTSKTLTAAVDWYSVGVMLYELITGSRPFDGVADNLKQLMTIKQHMQLCPPSELVEGIPGDLGQLCEQLLQIDPAARPTGAEVLRILDGGKQGGPAATELALKEDPFIGRAEELRELDQAAGLAQEGKTVVVKIHGSSGIGKTALVGRFLQELEEEALVLRGKCYESESVPYKALDGLVDELSSYLTGLGKKELPDLTPRDNWALIRLFPVLRYTAKDDATQGTEASDSLEVKRRATAALRELITRIGLRRRLVLFIDDLQWGDTDSAILLRELLIGPSPPRLLLVLAFRTADEERIPLLQELDALEEDSEGQLVVRERHLLEMGATETQQLVRSLDVGDQLKLTDSEMQEAHGNPYFLRELVRYVAKQQVDQQMRSKTVTLAEMIQARVSRLPEAARRLLTVVATAGTPVALKAARQATGLDGGTYGALELLRAEHMVRAEGLRGEDRLEPYHDRIRETVVRSLDQDRRREIHRALAQALEETGQGDVEALAVHYAEAGESQRAARYAEQAAEQATQMLAFDRAARLFAFALDLVPPDGEQRGQLQHKLADALRNAGRGEQAAHAYLAAAETVSDFEALDLRRQAAEQLLCSGCTEEGLELVGQVLGQIGMSFPRSPKRAVLSLLVNRAKLRLRGFGFRERGEHELSPIELLRIDTCVSLAVGLGIVDSIRGSDFQTRGLLLALKAGEPYRVARGLAGQVAYYGADGPRSWSRTQRLIDKTLELAMRTGHPRALAWAYLMSGIAHYLNGFILDAYEICSKAEPILLEQCTGVVWELDTGRYFMMLSLLASGQIKRLSQWLPPLIEDAIRRGNLYAEAQLRAEGMCMIRLFQDEPDKAREELRRSFARWNPNTYYMPSHWNLLTLTEIHLYCGEGEAAWKVVEESWPALKRSMLLMVCFVRVIAWNLRARAALAAADACEDQPQRRKELLRSAERDARRILNEKAHEASSGLGTLIQANVACARGQQERASMLLKAAIESFTILQGGIYLSCATRRLGELIGGDEGQRLIEEADRRFAEETILDPERTTVSYIPGSWWTPG